MTRKREKNRKGEKGFFLRSYGRPDFLKIANPFESLVVLELELTRKAAGELWQLGEEELVGAIFEKVSIEVAKDKEKGTIERETVELYLSFRSFRSLFEVALSFRIS